MGQFSNLTGFVTHSSHSQMTSRQQQQQQQQQQQPGKRETMQTYTHSYPDQASQLAWHAATMLAWKGTNDTTIRSHASPNQRKKTTQHTQQATNSAHPPIHPHSHAYGVLPSLDRCAPAPLPSREPDVVPTRSSQPSHSSNESPQPTQTRSLKRSGGGGFYECDMRSGSGRSLNELLHEADTTHTTDTSTNEYRRRPSFSFSSNEYTSLRSSPTGDPTFSMTPAVSPSSSSLMDSPVECRAPSAQVRPASLHSAGEVKSATPQLSPAEQEHLERTNLLGVLACTLEQLCPTNVTLPTDPHYLSLFHTSALPSISIRDYLFRLASYTSVSSECLIQACIHIITLARNGRSEVESSSSSPPPCSSPESLRSFSPESPLSPCSSVSSACSTTPLYPHPRINSFSQQPFEVSAYNIHRLLLTAILASAKFVDDAFYNNKVYSTLGGISLRELNRLECEFLHLVDYRMFITADVFLREWELMNQPHFHGAWCTKPNHPRGPTMRMQDEEVSDEDDRDLSSSESSVGLDVPAFQISPTTSAGSQENSRMTSVTQEETTRRASDSSMHDSRSTSAATTPIQYVSGPSASPPDPIPTAGYAAELVQLPQEDMSHASHHAHLSHVNQLYIPAHCQPSVSVPQCKPFYAANSHATLQTFQPQPNTNSTTLQQPTHAAYREGKFHPSVPTPSDDSNQYTMMD